MRFQNGSVVVIGGSVGGLATGLALARAGHTVTVLERDELPATSDPETAFETPRRGAPQARQTHGLLARLTKELRGRFPDVLDELFALGAIEAPLVTDALGDAEPGDDELAVLLVRRSTLDWVFRRAAEAQAGLIVRSGVVSDGLVRDHDSRPDPHPDRHPDRHPGAVPTITGVRLATGEILEADAVIAATGRRGDVPAWLAAVDIEIAEEEHDTNLLYVTRWYRLPDGMAVDMDPKMSGDLGFIKFLAVPGDAGTFSVTIAVPTVDRDLRSHLMDPDRFDRAARLIPGPGRVLDQPGVAPMSDVEPMGGFVNRLRHFLDGDGRPLVLGFHVVGDAHTCTNPFYGRGCSLTMVQAGLLADAFAAHPDDATARSIAYEVGSAREVEPWFHHSVELDGFLRVGGAPAAAIDEAEDAEDAGRDAGGAAAGMRAVMAAGATDPVIGRAMIRVFNLLLRPDELMADPEFLMRVAAIVADPSAIPLPPTEGPTRHEMLDTVAA